MPSDMKKDNSKTTILVICMGFLLVYLKFHWKWAIMTSLIVGLIGIISPFLSRQIDWLWMKLTVVLSYVVPNILLSIVFFVVLFPISLISRLFKKDPLMLSKNYKSYFIEMKKTVDKKSFEKIW
jgi:drug/metabolite transporter (DMT)-like permease